MTKFLVAERFTSPEGEGIYTGTMMRFIRFAGCSVGKSVCAACDTDFERAMPWRGGGEFTDGELAEWIGEYPHVEFTGGEPLDRDLEPIVIAVQERYGPGTLFHVQTSGTIDLPPWCLQDYTWVCVSPKPGWREDVVQIADEVKVIMPGLGVLRNGVCEGWPSLQDAL